MTLPCSDASRARAEPLTATASRVERWLLVEHCGPWGPPTLPLARMDPALAAHLTGEAARLGGRLLLLRHPRGVDCPPGRNAFVVDSRDGRESLRHRHFDEDAELLDPADLRVGAHEEHPPGAVGLPAGPAHEHHPHAVAAPVRRQRARHAGLEAALDERLPPPRAGLLHEEPAGHARRGGVHRLQARP